MVRWVVRGEALRDSDEIWFLRFHGVGNGGAGNDMQVER